MSTIAIIGGHGKVGLLTSRELASSGHSVRSVIRNPEHAAEVEASGAEAVVLDIERATPSELADALGPVDAVIFTAGAGGGSGDARKETVDHQGALKTIGAASELGVRRFAIVSYLGADEPAADPAMAAYQRAKHAADDAVRASSLDWTIVRPGHLNDDAPTRRVTIDDALTEGTTSRGNVAALLALLVTDAPAPRRVLNVVDGDTDLREALAR
ncbi:SDR family oxidoreductase [Naasia aerilata]|uniref:NAD-dependent dehydratase n=1 Tax=Naasia aerilata TaxID=1162966 RepID=A0ABN6XSZ3_9MICO|nr:SDR family oxidoreductase [Naasia aerilata]BDZ46740.1 NAD-dependent dehydratase [Naasia aerilata]